MKIVHLCLGCFYIDHYAYQENLLPKYHKGMGHEVSIVASLFTFDQNGKGTELPQPCSYINEFNIPVHRLGYQPFLGFLQRYVRRYVGLRERLERESPDLLFIHGCQFIDIRIVVAYLRNHPSVRVYVDNHADFSNSARNFVSRKLLHGYLWRYCAKLIEPFARKFYGVLPARVDFLKNVYAVPPEKVELLVMGADDDLVEAAQKPGVRESMREKLGVAPEDFLIITGGKIDEHKWQTLLLMKAVRRFLGQRVKLVVFGSVVAGMQSAVDALVDGDQIKFLGWVPPTNIYAYFHAADLAVFPGRHSVLWEQVCGLGVPMVVRRWEGTTHVDIQGSCKFLEADTEEEIHRLLEGLVTRNQEYQAMLYAAKGSGVRVFSYRDIARRSIEECEIACVY